MGWLTAKIMADLKDFIAVHTNEGGRTPEGLFLSSCEIPLGRFSDILLSKWGIRVLLYACNLGTNDVTLSIINIFLCAPVGR